MVFPTYKEYIDSGSRWLGDIPAHWTTKKLKFLAVVQPSNVDKKTIEDEVPVLLCNYTDVYKNEHIDGSLSFMGATATKEEIKKFTVELGDVIVTKDSEDRNDIAIPASASENVKNLVCGYHLTQIKPKHLDGRFLLRLFQSKGFNAQFIVAANGVTRFGLPQNAIANAVSPVPPIEEQKTIGRFLDHKTAQIDLLIAKKQSLLDKLAEQRTALISQAVTKGLDPSVSMKDSGVDWLGEIPGHWHRVLLVRLIIRFEQGWSPSCEAREASKDEWGVLKSGCVNYGIFDERQHKTLPASLTPIESLEVKPGNILMCRASGSKHLIGSVARIKSCRANLIFSDKTYRISLNEKLIDPDFFVFAMKSKYIREQIELSISGADGLANNIPQASVKSYQFVLPEIDEQRAIVKVLTEKSDRISLQEEKTKAVIERLQEYRSALITNAVTGKIDVRDFCIPTTTEQREVAHG
ncbi:MULTISPECIES: restriction endonuclease subunit S [Gammaproteobacteria]|jgi:type I restriction enzyme S subunit|uniref:restriction endonuclease subunit S n=1 Tax=Gammaproteobacteria TaxID=1236 RepID=UPI001C96F281|nr:MULTISPECIES: restriction endonuclease subunit S [Gammaproteobacteria]MBY5928925.1 restriction endonuclease subunit S [Halomonas sp. DP8Y7-3]